MLKKMLRVEELLIYTHYSEGLYISDTFSFRLFMGSILKSFLSPVLGGQLFVDVAEDGERILARFNEVEVNDCQIA
jgi:hypothetical protein